MTTTEIQNIAKTIFTQSNDDLSDDEKFKSLQERFGDSDAILIWDAYKNLNSDAQGIFDKKKLSIYNNAEKFNKNELESSADFHCHFSNDGAICQLSSSKEVDSMNNDLISTVDTAKQTLQNLPDELLSQPRFFRVGREIDGKWQHKIPIDKWNNPANQKLYSELRFTDNRQLAGFDIIGHDNADDFLVFDFDHVLDDEGNFVNDEVSKWFNFIKWQVDTYCEKSISGHGLHMILKPNDGEFPVLSANTESTLHFGDGAKLEIFYKTGGRYFLFTGDSYCCDHKTPIATDCSVVHDILKEISRRNAATISDNNSVDSGDNPSTAQKNYLAITLDEMKRILSCIPIEDISYADWALTVCTALIDWGKSINNLELAFNLFNEFSKRDTRPNEYSEQGCRTQWNNLLKGVDKEKKRGIGSLIQLAKSYGYTPRVDNSLFESTDKHNDMARARKIFNYCRNKLRYVTDLECYAIYDGIKWTFSRKDNPKTLYGIVTEMVQTMRKSARNGRNYNEAKFFENKNKLDAAISLICGIADATVMSTDFDKPDTSHLLNCRNGTINLKTGELLPHNPENYITHCANVDYNPYAHSIVVDDFLQAILPDFDTRAAILRFLGYSITGSVTEEAAMFARGSGSNGKSTLTKTLLQILGDYAGIVNSDVLLSAYHSKDVDGANPAVANLRGKRLAVGTDSKRGYKLDDSTIKRLCSRDNITARKLHENPIEFSPTHKLWISGNDFPDLKSVDDNGVNRRLVLVDFTQTFTGANCDPDLDVKLATEQAKSALLNILVDNAKSWYSAISAGASTGLIFSDAMNKTRNDYFSEQDWFTAAFDELFDQTNNPNDALPLANFRNVIVANCAEAKGLSSSQLNKIIDNGLKKLGVEKKRQKRGYVVYGIKEIGGIFD